MVVGVAYKHVFSNNHNDIIDSNLERQLQQNLPLLQAYGSNPNPGLLPLQLCEGDCDSSNDCDAGLVCFQRNAWMPVPGCRGGENFGANTDFCVQDPNLMTDWPTFAPTENPTFTPTTEDSQTISASTNEPTQNPHQDSI